MRFVLTAAGGLNRPRFARAFGDTHLCLRLQLLLGLQLVHLPEELLEQLAPFRADALLCRIAHEDLNARMVRQGCALAFTAARQSR